MTSENLINAMAFNCANHSREALVFTNASRDGLLLSPDSSSCFVITSDAGGGRITKLSNDTCHTTHLSLNDIGKRYFNLPQPSAQDILPYLVTPEMEVERIFNSLRYKYLLAVLLSNVPDPKTHLHYSYNKAFQSLAGLTVYQGNPPVRKPNDDFWREAGFTAKAKDLDWQKEQVELKRILTLLKIISRKSLSRVYAELIAIKPGFHELYLHKDYFDPDTIPTGTSPRDLVFRMLRNKEDLSSLMLSKLPQEMNKRNYFGYAPCNVTEGPFVFRKSIDVSYFDEIRRIRTKRQIRALKDKFHILDYYRHDLSTQGKLEKFLELAEPFCRYPAVFP
ncbi:MAG: hypothetical protein H7X83_11410 [Verrucomicrobia bacterium]|nr:hypothetical protein [Deltaproteobacteria bacterium]